VDIPATMLTLVGERILRLGTSYNRERFFFDIPPARRNNNRFRYGYYLPEGRIVRSLNLSNLLGKVVLDVYDGGTEGANEQKLVFETNPDGTKIERIILFLEITEPTDGAYWLLEEDPEAEWELEEDEEFWELEESDGPSFASIEDEAIPRNIYPDVNSYTNFYVIQEDDFEEPR
jgi:hypothetical protein